MKRPRDQLFAASALAFNQHRKGRRRSTLDAPAYFTYKTGYVDRDLTLAAGPFLGAVNVAIADLHKSGKLKELSIEFFTKDYATPAASFDLAGLGQKAP